jgi:hypothetical protein
MNAQEILVEKSLGSPRGRENNNIKMSLKEVVHKESSGVN